MIRLSSSRVPADSVDSTRLKAGTGLPCFDRAVVVPSESPERVRFMEFFIVQAAGSSSIGSGIRCVVL